MRVLLINDHGRAHGGAELQMLAIRDALRGRGHEVRLFASDAQEVAGYPNLADTSCKGWTGLTQVVTQTLNPLAWRALRRELRTHPPDVVHMRSFLWQLSPLILPTLRDVPVFHQAPVYKAICPNGLKLLPEGLPCCHLAGPICRDSGCVSPRTWRLAKWQMGMVRRWRDVIDVFSVLSTDMQQEFEAAGIRDVEVVPNGIDPRPAGVAKSDAPTVVYSGRLSREKGVELLLDAFIEVLGKVPKAQLHIMGTGPSEASLKAKAEPLGRAVVFHGHVPPDKVDGLSGAAWVQVVPSLWKEPFGNVTLEAMMQETAVIGTNSGGMRDVIAHGETGFVFPSGDQDALAAHLRDLLADKAKSIQFGRNGRALALSKFGRDHNLDQILECYDRAIKRHRRTT